MNKKGFTLVELIAGIIIGGIGVLIVIPVIGKMFVTIPYVYSEGERSGEIIKFSKKGMFFKTWEGELNTGVFQRKEGASTTAWEFSVKSPAVIERLIEASETGERVTLVYHEYILVSYRDGETDYIVVDVKKPK